MATYTFDENGNKIILRRYSTGAAFSLIDIFPDKKSTSNLIEKTRNVALQKVYKTNALPPLARQIFYVFVRKVLERVANGDVFIMPGRSGAYIALKKIPDREVRLLRQSGKYVNIDIIKSKFTIPRFVYDFGPKCTYKDRQIHIPDDIESIAFRNVEQGKIHWTTFRKEKRYDN